MTVKIVIYPAQLVERRMQQILSHLPQGSPCGEPSNRLSFLPSVLFLIDDPTVEQVHLTQDDLEEIQIVRDHNDYSALSQTPPSHASSCPTQRDARSDCHECRQEVEQHVGGVEHSVGQKPLDAFIDDSN